MGIINNLAKQVTALEKANGQLETKVKEQEETIKKLSESGKAINVENWSNVVTRNTKKPVEQSIVVNAALNEQRDGEKRRRNVIVFGINESQLGTNINDKANEDKVKIEKLFQDLNLITKPSFVKRLKSKKEDKPCPILVGLSEQSERNPLLLAAKKLRVLEQYKTVYISPDLTDAERLDDYNLRKQRDEMNRSREADTPFRYAIRGNSIIKINRDPANKPATN